MLPTSTFFYGMQPEEEISVEIESGKTLIIKFLTTSEVHEDGTRTVFFELNGPPREVPVMTLPNATLFPQALLPLYIFEPRYQQMVSDCLDAAGQIAMASFAGERGKWQEAYHAQPELRPAVCVGQIIQHEALPDGRHNILLHGVCRAKIVELDAKAAAARGDFESAIREALPTILASPKFLYRSERTPAVVRAGATHRISDLELASRLSFFLTGRMPDEQLLAVAQKGGLAQPKDLENKRVGTPPNSS